MRTLIVEDEQLATERIKLLLQEVCPEAQIVACTDSIEETAQWLRNQAPPDLILLDIHLADGNAFELFGKVDISSPVIFTTAYDQYAIQAFKVLSIDYLLKPVEKDALYAAIRKLQLLKQSAQQVTDYSPLLEFFQRSKKPYKSRFLGKIGNKSFFIDISDVAYFMADNKIVYLFTHDGLRYIIDHTLEHLETVLDPGQFFRANRSTIVHVSAIEQVKPYINSRLKLTIKSGTGKDELIVSRERVTDFRSWADS
ncbi:LytTR family DNA-binding domain-containing protein [Flavihumibacter rivuli]|uniref:LytR/AlgR family response regulator transcription factor n=1 Tax=Flavihumibacter rivuli TaxID=2838156 RepID=UPI001BDEEC21|nr:LytTR family DNA-binding domain-containing protein [Flavihumibacter rivuli]ULQ55322.1 LytTR family DNA-binding domain-containing protein [Flavihumibacter rivuli]